MKERATAIAIATLLVATGLSVAPPATAGHADCHRDFEVAEDKQNAEVRELQDEEEIVGRADVSSGTPEDLMVDLQTSNTQLSVEVFEKVSGVCTEYEPLDCDEDVSSTGDQQICQLDATSSQKYWIHYENTGSKTLDFQTWTPDA